MKAVLTTAVLFFSVACMAQSKGSLTLYGFKQEVSGAVPPDRTQGPGSSTKVYRGKNYRVYATAPFSFKPAEVWLEGVRFSVKATVVSTPVLYGDVTNIGSPQKTLVPKTGQTVWQLVPIIFKGSKANRTQVRQAAKKEELIVVYERGTRTFYSTLRRLAALEGGALM